MEGWKKGGMVGSIFFFLSSPYYSLQYFYFTSYSSTTVAINNIQ